MNDVRSVKRAKKRTAFIISAVIIAALFAARLFGGFDTMLKINAGSVMVIPVLLMNRSASKKFGYPSAFLAVIALCLFSGIVTDPDPENFIMLAVITSVVIVLTIIVQADRKSFEDIREFGLNTPDTGKIEEHYRMEVVDALLRAIDAKDSYTYKHSRRVAYYSRKLAINSGIAADEADKIYLAGMLHDIGKIGMKDNILNKTDKLDDMEYIEAKEHVVTGAAIATNLEYLQDVIPMMLHHHERYDGKGYPEQLKGDTIPVGARILAICDSYDAMTSDREYRKGMNPEDAAKKLMENIGTQYDPQLCIAFVEMIRSKSLVYSDTAG